MPESIGLSSEQPGTVGESILPRLRRRLHDLELERESWIDHWQLLSDYLLPRRARFDGEAPNRGTQRNEKIINSLPTHAARVLSSGMMSGVSSPARPWFKLITPDPALNDYSTVRVWLNQVEVRMMQVFAMSNIYNALPSVYSDLGVFGTTACIIDEDEEDVIRAYVLPIGRYSLANSRRLAVDTMFDHLYMTVAQMVEAFGLENCSERVQQLNERGQYDEWIEVVRCIEPNRLRQPGRIDRTGMAWSSWWFEVTPGGSYDGEDKFLRQSGYREFPVLAPRWDVTGEDVYGYSPGMIALGDSKALQLMERRKAQGIEKMIHPPMVAPASLRNSRTSQLPGDTTYVDQITPGMSYQPVMMLPPQAVGLIDVSIQQHERRIQQAFFADLWMMMIMDDRQQPATAREIAERHEEKLLMLGPVLERLHDELLDPLIDRTFNIMFRRGLIPQPPEELYGMPLRVEYISIMAQAQKMIGIAADERFAAMIGTVAKFNPMVLDKVNWDKFVEDYADKAAVNPELVLDQAIVDKRRAERAAQQEIQQKAMMMGEAGKAAQSLANAKLQDGKESVLDRMLANAGGGGEQEAEDMDEDDMAEVS